MSYTLYTDKSENFECLVDVRNASLKNSIARIVLETQDINLVFNGKIENNKCIVPIKKLKGFLDENSTGKMKLEIIVEDTYFTPWKTDFVVKENTKVNVSTISESTQIFEKPSVSVNVKSQPKIKKEVNTPTKKIQSDDPIVVLNELFSSQEIDPKIDKICDVLAKKHQSKKITLENLESKIETSKQIFEGLFSKHPSFKKHEKEIIKKTIARL